MGTAIGFRAFGNAVLVRENADSGLRLRRGLAALAYLLEAGRPIPRAMLAELLWPEQAEGVARERLRRLLHRIGQAAREPIVVSEAGDRLGVTPDLVAGYDVGKFRNSAWAALESRDLSHLRAATALIGPAFLDGLALDECAELDSWAMQTRLELENLILRLLRCLAEALAAAGDSAAALSAAHALVARDPTRESSHRVVLRLMLAAGDEDGAQAYLGALERRLMREVGVAPSEATRAILATAPTKHPTSPRIRYARVGEGSVAYSVVGQGGPCVVIAPGFVSHVEMAWEDAALREAIERLARGRRVLVFDRRGQGLSERLGVRPDIDEAARDILAIVQAEGLRRISIFGSSEGGPTAVRLANSQPALVERLVLFGTLAKGSRTPDYPHAMTRAQFDRWCADLVSGWGAPSSLEVFAPSRAGDPDFRAWWARLLRYAATPASVSAILSAFRDMDVRALLPTIRAPALVLHRTGDRAIRLEAGRALASALPRGRFVELPGSDHWWWCGDVQRVISEVEAFLG